MIDMKSEVHQERFMLRLNSDEMFGSRLYANLFGLFACVGFFCCCPRANMLKCPARLGLSLLMLGALYASHSKGAVLVGLCVGLLWLFEEIRRRMNMSWFWLGLPLSLGALALYLFKESLQASVQIRLDYWQVALNMLGDHILGVGALNFSEYYGRYMHPMATEVKMAHNDHLQFFCEFGVAGGILHLLFLGFLIYKTHQQYLHKDSDAQPETSTLWWGFMLFAVYMCLTCLQMKLGPWDLPVHGFSFIALGVGGIAYLGHKIHIFDSTPWAKWAVLLVVLHAFIDMPLYDHSLVFLVLAACFLDHAKPDFNLKFPALLQTVGLTLSLVAGVLSIQRYQHMLISDWMGIQKEFRADEVKKQVEVYAFDHQALEPIYRNWDRLSQPDVGISEETFLRNLLSSRPFNSGHALRLARYLGGAAEAEKWYRKAYENHPQQPRYAYFLGVYLKKIGQVEASRDYLFKALARHDQAKELSKINSDFKLHLLQPEQFRKAIELTRN
jgi:hypothetical protein